MSWIFKVRLWLVIGKNIKKKKNSGNCHIVVIDEIMMYPIEIEGRMWDLIVSVPDHCLSFYFVSVVTSLVI